MREFFEKHKIETYAILGLVFAFILWFVTQKQNARVQTVQVPYLTPQPFQQNANQNETASQTPTISEQGNIIGDHPNNVVPNGSTPQFTIHGVPPHGFTPTGNQGYWNLTPSGDWAWTDYHPIAFPTTQPNVSST